MASRVKPHRFTPVLKHVPDVSVKEPKQSHAKRDQQCGLEKFEYGDQP
jgi:hypothetical protein